MGLLLEDEHHYGIELEAVLKRSKDNIVIADGAGVVLRASPNCFAIYGKEAEELIGITVDELEQMNIFSPSVTKKVLRRKKEVQLMQYTSTGRIVMATGFPVINEKGELIRVISFSHDLTELQNLKEDYHVLQTKMKYYESEIKELQEQENHQDIVLKSKEMLKVWDLIKRVANSDATIVFLGESGTGKNVFARAVHERSERTRYPFIEVNCGAIPEQLFESEMFGYESGAFTGANKNGKSGLMELANNGTLFLDEVGELPLLLQTKLLKVIQEKKVTRIGGLKAKDIDFRIIASTNKNLEEMVDEGKFRQDLYYRLNVIPITIPSLKERTDEILFLCDFYLKKFNKKYKTNRAFHISTIDILQNYKWPGNVRELENLIERLVITVEERLIYPVDLPFYIVEKKTISYPDTEVIDSMNYSQTLNEALEEVERRWLKRAKRQFNTTYEMARFLGISQSSVVRKLKKYTIDS